MENRHIMTAFGKDRPGIVADVTKMLYENGCNLEDTSMTLLADEFTLILLFTCKDHAVEDRLLKECRRLEKERGLSAFMRPLGQRPLPKAEKLANCTLHVEGLDQAGIVYKVSQFLADSGINIVDLKSEVKASPESGTSVYMMDIHVQLPKEINVGQFERGMAEVADALNVDISLTR